MVQETARTIRVQFDQGNLVQLLATHYTHIASETELVSLLSQQV